MGILHDLIGSHNADGPAGKAPGEAAVVVDPLGDEFLLAAENPVSFFLVKDAEPLVEPTPAGKNINKLSQNILWLLAGGISQRAILRFHLLPISGRNQAAGLCPLSLEGFPNFIFSR
jgi:hypothetical protein